MPEKIAKSEELDLIKRATEYAKDRKFDQAIEVLKSLLQSLPNHELGLGMLASLYAEIGMNDRAIENFEKIISLNAENPLAVFQLGLIHFKAGRAQKALDIWQSALSDTDYMMHFYSGLALQSLARIDEAKSMFEQAAKTMPKDHALFGQLQELLKSLG